VRKLINSSKGTSCCLNPIPTLLLSCIDPLIPVITKIINSSLESGIFLMNGKRPWFVLYTEESWPGISKNLRPISNLACMRLQVSFRIVRRQAVRDY